MNRAQKMLGVLRDGEWHTRQEIFAATDSFFLTNNAASELRRSGYLVDERRDGREHSYRLSSGLDEAPAPTDPSPGVSSSPVSEPELLDFAEVLPDAPTRRVA